MTLLVSCVVDSIITEELSVLIKSRCSLVVSDPLIYAHLTIYNKLGEVTEEKDLVSKLEYWQEIGRLLELDDATIQSYIEEKLTHNTTKSLKEFIYSGLHPEPARNILIVTYLDGELIIE